MGDSIVEWVRFYSLKLMRNLYSYEERNKWEAYAKDVLPHSPAASYPMDPSELAPTQTVPLQGILGRINQLAPATSYIGVPLVSIIQGYHMLK